MDRTEENLRRKIMSNDPKWMSFKEGTYISPGGNVQIEVCAQYECTGVNVTYKLSDNHFATIGMTIEAFNILFCEYKHTNPYVGAY